MKIITKLMLVLSACWLITACGAKSPSQIAEIVMKASQTLDFETAKKYLAEERFARFEEKIKDFNEYPESKEQFLLKVKDATFEVISEDINEDGTSATVTLRVSKVKGEEGTFDEEIELVKVNGEWKVNSDPL
jgi:predicted lipid-binding transport protein (Tim44 family)